MTAARTEVHLIGGDINLEGVLRMSRGRYWIRQGFSRVLIFVGLDLELMIGQRVTATGKRARARKNGWSKDAIWLTARPQLTRTSG
jgi:hypothetical protein